MHPFVLATLGGVLIGIAASLMLYWNGRVTGIAGISAGILKEKPKQNWWRWSFLFGLFFGGLLLKVFYPGALGIPQVLQDSPKLLLVAAGLFVGVGTSMANGCTSGHAICGISRLSMRSIIATVTFMLAGIITASLAASLASSWSLT